VQARGQNLECCGQDLDFDGSFAEDFAVAVEDCWAIGFEGECAGAEE